MSEKPTLSPLAGLNLEFDKILERTAKFVPAAFHIHSKDSHDWGAKTHADSAKNARTRFEGSSGVKSFLDELALAFRIVCILERTPLLLSPFIRANGENYLPIGCWSNCRGHHPNAKRRESSVRVSATNAAAQCCPIKISVRATFF